MVSPAATTVCVCAELALADPAELLAVTTTRSVAPRSAPTTVYELLLAPPRSTQPGLQRCH